MKPLDRSGVIRQSVSVFLYGAAGLLPLIGLIPAVSAVIRGIQIRRAYSEPNPVDHYRKWGMALGSLCILLNACAVVIVIINVFNQANHGVWINNALEE
jgi:hypothetical protein